MNPVTIILPEQAWLVSNTLCDTNDPVDLAEDLVLVRLPSSTFIDVSWKPEHDPAGCYVVTVYRGSWDNQLRRFTTLSAAEAARRVEALAKQYSPPGLTNTRKS